MRQRARIARVRRLQHGLAASSAAVAADQLRALESSHDRLAAMRFDLAADEGMTSGAGLATRGELAMRLEAARIGLVPGIDAARTAAAAREQARLKARQDQESADRLEQAAARALAEMAERRTNRPGRRRPLAAMGGTDT